MKLDDLQKYISFASVSTDEKYRGDVEECAEWISGYLSEMGMVCRIMATDGAPVVYCESKIDKKKKTVLVYGHYDVQPAEPVSEWSVPPFEGQIRDDYIYGRGVSDNKGQFWCHVLAIQEYRDKGMEIPVNLKILLEGEEEVGSPNLERFVEEHKEMLACDVAWISDGMASGEEAATIDAGLRGCENCEIIVKGPDRDLHSGSYGGAIANPINEIAKIIARLVDEDGRVSIPGFYKGVDSISSGSKEAISREKFSEVEFLKKTGAKSLSGEPGFNTQERIGLRPTLQVTGIYGGYTGPGFKNIVPKEARANINIRLVAGQRWEEVERALGEYLAEIVPDYLEWEIKYYGGNDAYLVDPDQDVIVQAKQAFDQVFPEETAVRFEGGSLPVANYFSDHLTENVLLSGWAQDMHVVDEKLALSLIKLGTRAVTAYWHEVAGGS